MNSKLLVRNLSDLTTEDTLRKLFSQSGSVVSVNLITDQTSRRSKGYAFITMSDALYGEEAIGMFNGFSLDGSQIQVSFAQHRAGLSAQDNGQLIRPFKRDRKNVMRNS